MRARAIDNLAVEHYQYLGYTFIVLSCNQSETVSCNWGAYTPCLPIAYTPLLLWQPQLISSKDVRFWLAAVHWSRPWPENCPAENCQAEDCQPENCQCGKLPVRKIASLENCQQGKKYFYLNIYLLENTY